MASKDEEVKTPIGAEIPKRPASVEYASLSELFARFMEIFLQDDATIVSPCGHAILVFDHHFFHLAAITAEGKTRLFMRDERETIVATTDGFGDYSLNHKGSRAKHLASAYDTMCDPDEIWGDCPKAVSAKWVYAKEYDSKPYPFSIVLVTERPEQGGIIVPVSQFPCTRADVKKWRAGTLIYSKNTKAAK